MLSGILQKGRNLSWKTQHNPARACGSCLPTRFKNIFQFMVRKGGIIGEAITRTGIPASLKRLIIKSRRFGAGARGSIRRAKAPLRVVTETPTAQDCAAPYLQECPNPAQSACPV